MPALSYAHGASTTPLLGQTLGENLRHAVHHFADREALVVRHQGYRATYRELGALIGLAARGLIARGIEPGDRVGIWSPNRFEWVVLQFAAARAGAILVNINPAYKSVELEHVLKTSGVKFLALARGFRTTNYGPLLAAVRDRCPQLQDTLVFDGSWEGEAPAEPSLHRGGQDGSAGASPSQWQAFLDAGRDVEERELEAIEARLQFDDPINIQYTSGTTGAPKGATLSHHNLLNNAWLITGRMRYTERDRVCVPVPFYHCFGMVFGSLGCVCRGACMVVPGESFDPLTVLETVQAENCTSLYGVPTMFIAELGSPRFGEFDLSSLRTGIMAGSPCPVETMKQVRDRMHMREVTIVCGMTETSPGSTQTSPDDPIDKRVETVGRPLDHAEIKIIDPETGAIVPRGMPGEQCTRGSCVMLGYWNDPEATAKSIDAAGWMHTGDLAVMDDEDYVSIVGRIKDVIIRGGENVYPREVEEFLHTLPGVAEAQVIGVPCNHYGEEVMAWVRLTDGTTLSSEELVASCRGRIATYKIPRHWKFVDSFPLTVTGKVQKYRMREVSAEELGRGG